MGRPVLAFVFCEDDDFFRTKFRALMCQQIFVVRSPSSKLQEKELAVMQFFVHVLRATASFEQVSYEFFFNCDFILI